MADIEGLLNRWQKAGVLEAESANRIRAFESEQKRPTGLRWQGMVALILGALLLACGVVLFVSAHWGNIGPGARYAIIMGMIAVFHIAGGYTRAGYYGLSTAFHAVGTLATGAAIALVGQIFNIQDHWPAAVLLWAIAALAGWILLHDEIQQSLTLLLLPAWVFSEFAFSTERHIGQSAYLGRFLFVWAILYLTASLGWRRRVVQGIVLTAAAIASVCGIVSMLENWTSWSAEQTFLPLSTRLWGWTIIALLPLFIALFRLRKSMIPVTAAILFSIALPWCYRHWTQVIDHGTYRAPYTYTVPNLAAHALVTAFAVFIIWWGVRQASRALVNLGIAGFAIAVAWFYFSDVFDKVGRSLGLIGLGILFLLGGWALEKTRRGLISHMAPTDAAPQEAK